MIANTIEIEFTGNLGSLTKVLNQNDFSVIRSSRSNNSLLIYSNVEYNEQEKQSIIDIINGIDNDKEITVLSEINIKNISQTPSGTINNSYGTPSESPLGSINNRYNIINIGGSIGNAPSNISELNINYDESWNRLSSFNVTTTDGVNSWWSDLKNNENTFNSPMSEVTIVGSNIPNLDGGYWVNTIGNDFVMVSKTDDFTLYFSNQKVQYIPNIYNQNLLVMDQGGFIKDSNININKFGSEIYFSEKEDISVSSNSFKEVVSLDVPNLEMGRYKMSLNFNYQISTKKNPRLDYLISLNSDKIDEFSINDTIGDVKSHESYTKYFILSSEKNTFTISFKSKYSCSIDYLLVEVIRIN